MKIAHIVCSYPPYYGGMGNVVFQTASALSDLGHAVEVFTPQYGNPPQEDIEYARRLKPEIQYGQAARLGKIKKILNDFDLVHLHYPFFGTANLIRKWKENNPEKPLVITYHMDTRAPGWKGLIFKYYSKYWMPKILGSADKLIASSYDYIDSSDARQLYKKNKYKWLELPFGVDTKRFVPRKKPEALLNRHGLNPELPILLFVGGMDLAHYFKGIPVLLKAMFFLKQNKINTQLVLVGDGELKEKFILQARGLGLESQVIFVGKIPNDELSYYYNLADLFILPSINQGEAFGMVLLEAMASGVPVVTTDLPGVRQVAGDAGLIVKPNDPVELAKAITGYFGEDKNMPEWSERVRLLAQEKYAWDKIVANLEAVYKDLVGA